MVGTELLDGLFDFAPPVAQDPGGVHDLRDGVERHRIFGEGRSGGKRQQSDDAKNGEETFIGRPHVQPFSTSATSSGRTGRHRMQQRPHAM